MKIKHMNLFQIIFFGINAQDMIFDTIVDFHNVAERSEIVLLYQFYSIMLLLILVIYHLFNEFEILVVIAVPKFGKVPNFAKFLQEMSNSFVRYCQTLLTSFKVFYKTFYST